MKTSQMRVSPLGASPEDDHILELERNPKYAAALANLRLARELAERIIAYRIEHDLTQQQLAEQVGLVHSVISRLERGDRPVNLSTYARLGSLLAYEVHLVDSGSLAGVGAK